MIVRLLLILVMGLLSGCASVLSDEVLEAEPTASFAWVRDNPEQSVGKRVIVGGRLLGLHENQGHSFLEVLEHPLDSELRPLVGDYSEGRFLIKMADGTDPSIWAEDRLVTLAGRVEGVQARDLGQTQYQYPVLILEEVHLWPEAGGYYPSPYFSWGIGGGFSF